MCNLSPQRVNSILHNPIYAGIILRPKCLVEFYPDLPEMIEGKHEPIVSKELFYLVQDILGDKHGLGKTKNTKNPNFPLKGDVRCTICGSNLTAYHKYKNNKRYDYYKCIECSKHVHTSKDKIEKLFYQELERLEPNKDLLRLFRFRAIEKWQEHNKYVKNEERNIKSDITKLKTRLKKVENLVIDGTFDKETYKENKAEIEESIRIKEIELSKTEIDETRFQEQVDFSVNFFSNLGKYWLTNEYIATKQKIQRLVYPEGLEFDGEKFRTPVTIPILRYLHENNTPEINYGTPERIRTSDLRFRKPVLYPTELPGHECTNTKLSSVCQSYQQREWSANHCRFQTIAHPRQ